MDRVTAQFRAPVVGVARHFIEMHCIACKATTRGVMDRSSMTPMRRQGNGSPRVREREREM